MQPEILMNCQVCGTGLNGSLICPACGYEHHEWLQPSQAVQEFEERRLAAARDAWNRLEDEKNSVTRNQPLGFLITEDVVVYCIYEGENSFGSAKVADGTAMHQKLILPGYSMRPVHFSVEVTKAGTVKSFTIKEVNPASEPSIGINSQMERVEGKAELQDGDNILLSVGSKTAVIRFRVNLNAK